MASKYTIRGVADMSQHDEQLQRSAAEVYKYERNVRSASGQLNQFSDAARNVASGVSTLNDGFAIMNNSTAPLKLKLRELTNILADLELEGRANTEEFTQLAEYAGSLSDAIGDARAAVSGYADDALSINAATEAMGTLASVGSVATGVMGMLGVENDNLQRTLVKVQSAMAVANGIQQIANNLNADSALMLRLRSVWNDVVTASTARNSVATGVNTVATNANTVATRAWNVAKAISKALFGDLTGLILVGAAALATYSIATDKAKDSEEEQNRALEEAKKKIDEQREAYVNATAQYNNTASRIDHLRSAYINTNSELEKTAIIQEATAEFKKLGISVNNAAEAQDILVNKGQYVIELLRLQGNAAALAALRMEAYKKSFNMLLENGYDTTAASILAGSNSEVQNIDKRLDELYNKASELKRKLKIGTSSKTSSTTSNTEGKGSNEGVKFEENSIKDYQDKLKKINDELNNTNVSDDRLKKLLEEKKVLEDTIEQLQIRNGLITPKEESKVKEEPKVNVEPIIQKGSLKEIQDKLSNANAELQITAIGTDRYNELTKEIRELTEKEYKINLKIDSDTEEKTIKISNKWKKFGDNVDKVSQSIGSMGQSFKDLNIDTPVFDIMGAVGQAVANIALSFSQAMLKPKDPWSWIIFGTTGLAQMVATIASIKNATAGYANGGIVGGTTTIGDYNIARVNKGEMILNSREQSRLFNILNGNGGYSGNLDSSTVQFKINGNDLVGVLNNFNKKRSKVM